MWNCIKCGSLAIMTAALLLCSQLAAQDGANLISNGGFEKSFMHKEHKVEYPEGFSQQYHRPTRITNDAAHVHSGKKAVHLRSDLYYTKMTEAKPGDRFRIRAWVKGKGRMEFVIFEYDSDGWIIQENIVGNAPLTDEYKEISFIYAPEGLVSEKLIRSAVTFLPYVRVRNIGEEEGYIDDWRLEKIEPGKTEIEKTVIWPDEGVVSLSESESQRANLVARPDYDLSPRWALQVIKGRTFWWTLREAWYRVKWLRDEPLLKYCMRQVGFDQRKYAALRELELYGPDGEVNLARGEGVKLISRGSQGPFGGVSGVYGVTDEWNQLELLTDGKAPRDTKFEWVKIKDAAYYGSAKYPVKAWAGVEFPEPATVNRAVICHGHNMNHTILGEYVAQADIADNFVLEYSTDGKTWQEIPGTEVEGNRQPRTEHKFKPVSARAIRVHIKGQAAPIPPEPGKAWKNMFWALREHVARGRPDYHEKKELYEKGLKEVPFIGMEPYRRTAYALRGEDRERLRRYFEPVMADFERYYGDSLVGFLVWEWDNDLFKAFRHVPEFKNPKSWRTKYEFMAEGLKSASEIYRGYMMPQGNGMRPWGHYMFEVGAKAVMEEMKGGYGSGMFQVQTTFMRSAGRQYGKPWGTYPTPRLGSLRQKNPAKSEFSPLLGRGGAGFDYREGGWYVGPFQGVSPYWWKRTLYGNYFAGENLQDMELGVGTMVYRAGSEGNKPGDYNRGHMIPQGIVTRDMARFIEKHGDRGVLYTPLAFAIDYWGGWTQCYASWPGYPLRWGDDEISELMLTFFPVCGRNPMGFGYEVANKDMADTPFGECFDVLKPNPPSGTIAQDALDGYKVLWVAGSWRETPDELVERMKAYVRAGGTLVLNAAHVRGGGFNGRNPAMALAPSFLGVEFAGEHKTATKAVFPLDDEGRKPLSSEAFRYAVVRPTSARAIARTPDGDPLITLNKVGKGHVILTTTWYNLTNQKQRIVPAAERLLAYLTHQAMPVEVKGRIRYLVTRRKDGWVVALLNNKGIFKSSQANAEVDHLQRVTVNLTLREPALHVSEWSQDYTSWPFEVKGGATHCGITVPPGDVRVLFFKTK